MTVVILAEKPDQAKKFASALSSETLVNRGGKFEFHSEIFGKTIVTWGIGHLVSLSLPEKYQEQDRLTNWSLSNLPFLPSLNSLKYEISEGKAKQFNVVKNCLNSANKIIIATDPDREGENIAYSIFKLCSQEIKNKEIKRLWINSLVKDEILKGFKNLRNSHDTKSLYEEASARQISDYLVGMNYTELFTVKLQEKGIKGVTSLGRVQTPVNTIVVENDLAIKNFKSQKYFKFQCIYEIDKNIYKFDNSKEYFDHEEFVLDTKKFDLDEAKSGKVVSIDTSIKETLPPNLFSLAAIQEYANKNFKFTSKKTNEIIQKLYDEGFLSYPRTSSELITTNELLYLKSNLETYKGLLGLTFETIEKDIGKRYVDNEKVLEHYAIIPTEKIPVLSDLKSEERMVYTTILERTCGIFCIPYKYSQSKITIDVNGLIFSATGHIPVDLGWKKIFDNNLNGKNTELNELPELFQGDTIPIDIIKKENMTKIPERMTEAKLLGKNGIMTKLPLGTPATRSNIINTLIKRDLIKIEDNKIFPTKKGYLLWDLTANKNLLIGKTENSGLWEESLSKISKRENTKENFLKNIYKYVNKTITDLKDIDFESVYIDAAVDQNILKILNYTIEIKSKVFEVFDENTKEKFIIYKKCYGKVLSTKIVIELLSNKRTKKKVSNLVSQKGTKYSAYLLFDSTDKKIKLEF